MGNKGRNVLRRPWGQGAVRGAVGAMAMTGMRQLEVGVGAIERTPPEALLREGVPAILGSVPRHRRVAAIELMHWGYGAVAGSVYALAPAAFRRHWLSGPLYGVLVWGAFEFGLAPLLGLAHAQGPRLQERTALLIDHTLFGVVVGEPPRTAGGRSQGQEEKPGPCCPRRLRTRVLLPGLSPEDARRRAGAGRRRRRR